MKFILLVSVLFLLNACSVYKSQGRKQFETDSATKISAFELKTCQKQNALTAWFQAEFPTRTYELVTSETDLEVWKSRADDGTIEIKAIQTSADGGRTACTYSFASEAAWNGNQEQFLQELSNNMMTTD